MTIAVIVTCEAVGAYTDGGYGLRLLHIDVGRLPDIEIAIPHRLEGVADLLQVCSTSYQIRTLLSTLT